MEPEIIRIATKKLVGVASEDGNIGALWDRFMAGEGEIAESVPGAGYELHVHDAGGSLCEVMVGVEVSADAPVPEGMVARELPAGEYAVFTHRLAGGGYTGANERMNAWLREGPYRLSPNWSIQVYGERFKGGSAPDSEIDFWLPVVPKA